MKTKSMVLLAMALGCGLVAMLGVQQILSGEQKVKDTVPVLVAKQEIGAGVKLDPAQVARPVVRGVEEPARVDLVEDGALEPQRIGLEPLAGFTHSERSAASTWDCPGPRRT